MDILLFFFAIPIAIIILSAILETFIHCPYKVAGIFFSIFLVVAFAISGTVEAVVLVIIYTILSFITAFIFCFLRHRGNFNCSNSSFEFENYNSAVSIPSVSNTTSEENTRNILSNDFNIQNQFAEERTNLNCNNRCRRCR